MGKCNVINIPKQIRFDRTGFRYFKALTISEALWCALAFRRGVPLSVGLRLRCWHYMNDPVIAAPLAFYYFSQFHEWLRSSDKIEYWSKMKKNNKLNNTPNLTQTNQKNYRVMSSHYRFPHIFVFALVVFNSLPFF